MDANMPIAASQGLQLLRHDSAQLFLGSAFLTVGIVSALFALLGRKFDAMLIWLALFAAFYGLRLWMRTDLVYLAFHASLSFHRIYWAISYLAAIPAYLFFHATGYVSRRRKLDWPLVYVPIAIMAVLATAAFVTGPHAAYEFINSVVVVLSLIAYCALLFLREHRDRSAIVLRTGLLVFIFTTVLANLLSFRGKPPVILEPAAFAFLLGTLGYVAAHRSFERDAQLLAVQKELEVAEQIQRSILPGPFPLSTDFQVAARYLPMTTVAGDFYDYLVADAGRAGLLVADVSGHGVPAALIASMVKLAAASQSEHAANPSAFLSGMNRVLCGNTQHQFVTASYLYLDAQAGEMHYAGAAHPPALLVRDGQVQQLSENGLMMGLFDTATYTMASLPLRAGDRFLLYTDGVVEAANTGGEEFGAARLHDLLAQSRNLPGHALADLILARVRGWSVAQEDDLTVMVCDYQPVSA